MVFYRMIEREADVIYEMDKVKDEASKYAVLASFIPVEGGKAKSFVHMHVLKMVCTFHSLNFTSALIHFCFFLDKTLMQRQRRAAELKKRTDRAGAMSESEVNELRHDIKVLAEV